MLVGLIARMATIEDVFAHLPPHAFSEDDHYHLRRVMWGLRNAGMLELDPFMSFPMSAYSWWPDGFDRLLIAVTRAMAGADARMPAVVAVCSLMIPILSILALPLVYWLGARLYGRWHGALAALIVALLPAHAFAGLAGVVDHHCTETSLSLLPLLVLGSALSASSTSRRVWLGALAGALLGLTLHVWSGAPLISVVVVGAIGLATLGLPREKWRAVALTLAAFAVANLLATWEAVMQTPLGQKGEYVTFIVSRFHLLFAGILAALLALWIAAGSWAARGDRRIARHLGGFTLALLVLAPPIAFACGVRPRDLADVTAFVRSEGIVAWIEETAPLWASWQNAFAHFSPLLVLLPPFAALEAWRAFQKRETDPFAALLQLAGLAFLVLTFLQFRHKVHWVAFAAVLLVRLVERLSARLGARFPSQARAIRLALVLAVIALFYKPLTYLRDVTLRPSGDDVLLACDFIREHTPAAADPYRAGAAPQYSVLGSWDVGKTIAGVCERPSLGSADAYGPQLAGVLDLMRFFTTSDAREGDALLDRYRVRYLLLPAQYVKHWEAMVSMLGLDGARFFSAPGVLGDAATTSLYNRLYRFDGAALASSSARLPALRDLRLIYESRVAAPGEDPPIAKVFERVEGVVLTAQLAPRQLALLESEQRSNTGRRFTYRDFALADDTGRLRVQFPYLGRVLVRTPSGSLSADVRATDRGELILK
jgi:dolichyl-diphosphooligosaccharide--protein glycosyltransferase